MTAARAAKYAGMHAATLSKVESATTRIQPGTAQALMRYYGGSEAECDAVFDLAHAARQRGWWQTHKAMPDWFDAYVGLETEARLLRDYQSELIHGLLQTEQYAFHLARAAVDVSSDEEAQAHVALRMARQGRLTADNPVELHAIMNESALYREVGGTETMRSQLAHLRERCELPNVTCQILPYSAGAHAAGYGSFLIMAFPESPHEAITFDEVVYVEYGLGALYLEDSSDVFHFTRIFNDLCSRALNTTQSLKLIERALNERTT